MDYSVKCVKDGHIANVRALDQIRIVCCSTTIYIGFAQTVIKEFRKFSMGKLENRMDKIESEMHEFKGQVRVAEDKSVSRMNKFEKELESFKAEMDETLTKYSQDIKNSLKSVDETEMKSVVGAEVDCNGQVGI